MARNNLFDPLLLQRLATCSDDRIIERVPSEDEVIRFLNELDANAIGPLFNHFTYSERDGSVAVTFKQRPIPGKAINEHDEHEVHLITSVQDYTRRSRSKYSQRWHNYEKISNPEYIAEVIDRRLSSLQRYILEICDPYLHQLFYYPNKGKPEPPTFVIETAGRYKPGDEPRIGHLPISTWPEQNNHSRVSASAEQITLWAILMLVPPIESLDAPRISLIEAAIKAGLGSRAGKVSSSLRPYNIIEGYNLHYLLRSRHAEFMDGRARYPVIMGAVMDQSLLRPWGQDAEYARENQGIRAPIIWHPPVVGNVIPRKTSNARVLILVPLLTILTCATGLLFLVQMDGSNDIEVIGIAIAICSGLFTPASCFWLWVFTRGFDLARLASFRRELTARELMEEAAEMDEPDNKGTQVQTVMSLTCRRFYDGTRLSFSPHDYTGDVKFDRKWFKVTELLLAGFEMGYCMDGREALVAPTEENEVMRLEKVHQDGRCTFKELKGCVDITKEFIFRARGTWWRDVEVGT